MPMLAHAQGGRSDDPDKPRHGSSVLPAGWHALLDTGGATIDGVNLMEMGGGFHFMTGPAGIYYKPEDAATGTYEAHATFILLEPSEHPEAFGLFIGGSSLDGPHQRYTYFLVRQDGMFLIKRRAGTETPVVVNWTPNPAVRQGRTSNVLSIEAGKDTVRFLVNGTEVSSLPRSQVDADGIVGQRINHNLNVMFDTFGIRKSTGAHP